MKKQQSSRRPTGAPVFTYFSVCCNEQATKPACIKVPIKERETQGLGSWRCGKCKKPCAVNRQKNGLDKAAE